MAMMTAEALNTPQLMGWPFFAAGSRAAPAVLSAASTAAAAPASAAAALMVPVVAAPAVAIVASASAVPVEGVVGSCVTMSCFLHPASGVLLGASQDHGGERNWKWRIQAEMRLFGRTRSPVFPAVGVRWGIFPEGFRPACQAVAVSMVEDRYGAAMGRALELARRAAERGEVPVGAVVLGPDGGVVAEAANAREAQCDPTAHAEILALRAAGAALGDSHLDGCALVVTLEPCTMCAGAIQLARLARVVLAAWEPRTGACGSVRDVLRDPRANHRVEVVAGVRAEESRALLAGFFERQRGGGSARSAPTARPAPTAGPARSTPTAGPARSARSAPTAGPLEWRGSGDAEAAGR